MSQLSVSTIKKADGKYATMQEQMDAATTADELKALLPE